MWMWRTGTGKGKRFDRKYTLCTTVNRMPMVLLHSITSDLKSGSSLRDVSLNYVRRISAAPGICSSVCRMCTFGKKGRQISLCESCFMKNKPTWLNEMLTWPRAAVCPKLWRKTFLGTFNCSSPQAQLSVTNKVVGAALATQPYTKLRQWAVTWSGGVLCTRLSVFPHHYCSYCLCKWQHYLTSRRDMWSDISL